MKPSNLYGSLYKELERVLRTDDERVLQRLERGPNASRRPLLISSSNGGGLFILLDDMHGVKIDSKSTTGLDCSEGNVYRAIQRNAGFELLIYSVQGVEKRFYPEIQDVHDIKMFHKELYVVSTGSNEVVVLDENLHIGRKRSFDVGGDSWHLNCLTEMNDRLYCSAFCEISAPYQYKGRTLNSGFLFDVETGERILTGLSQPHSPVASGSLIYICNSELKEVIVKDHHDQLVQNIPLGGYTRGLHIEGDLAYIGTSKNRAAPDTQSAGQVRIVDLRSLEIQSTVLLPFNEIYDIKPVDEELVKVVLEHPYPWELPRSVCLCVGKQIRKWRRGL